MFFVFFDTILKVEIEKRDDIDAMIKRKTFLTQNIDFFDITIDITNKIKKIKYRKSIFDV